jgi:hypothetical protein
MRRIELSGVRCEGCGGLPAPAEWGRRCPTCGGTVFSVDLERSALGLNGENLVDALLQNVGSCGGEVGFLVDVLMDDVGGSGVYFESHTALACSRVSADEIQDFLGAALEARIRIYIGWKRREVEAAALPPDHRFCVRCRVAYKVYDNLWGRSGCCSKACHRAFLKRWAG